MACESSGTHVHVELNRLREYLGRNLLCVTHCDRPMDESSDINILEARYASPIRLPPLQPFDELRPSREHVPYLGTISLYDIGDAGDCSPELVCAFRPRTYKAMHCLWDGDRLWVLGAEHIEIYDADLNSVGEIRDPWLAGNHTIAPDGRGRLLVSCAASDSVLTVDAETGDVIDAWRMPEHAYGFNYPLARHDSVTEHYIINDYQLAHVNSAWPWRRGILTTSKIPGAIGWFDADAQYHELLRGFVGCHGARVRSDVEEIFFCDSAAGMLVFMDPQGRIIRRVGTGSRWLHDAIQVRGDLFVVSPFDQKEVVLLNVTTRTVVGRIPCGDRGGPSRLSFGIPPAGHGESLEDDRSGVRAAVAPRGQPTEEDQVTAALRRQHAGMVRARDALIAAHTEAIDARDRAIATLREEHVQAVITRDRIIAELDAARASAVAGLQEEIGLRDRMLAELNDTVIRLQQTAGLAQEEVNRRDRMLAELNDAVIRSQQAAGHTQEEINRRDRMLAELNEAVIRLQQTAGRAQEEINRRDRMLGETNQTLIELQHSLALAQEEINRRDRLLAELQERLSAALKARDAAIDRESASRIRGFSRRGTGWIAKWGERS